VCTTKNKDDATKEKNIQNKKMMQMITKMNKPW
jgi:hypothetical protein